MKRPWSLLRSISWRRVLLGALVGGLAFQGLSLLTWGVPFFSFLVGAVFLPVGLWVGWGSRRPWPDGLAYGLLAALGMTLLLLSWGPTMSTWSLRLAFLLALPQGLLGTWLGALLSRHAGKAGQTGPTQQDR